MVAKYPHTDLCEIVGNVGRATWLGLVGHTPSWLSTRHGESVGITCTALRVNAAVPALPVLRTMAAGVTWHIEREQGPALKAARAWSAQQASVVHGVCGKGSRWAASTLSTASNRYTSMPVAIINTEGAGWVNNDIGLISEVEHSGSQGQGHVLGCKRGTEPTSIP